LSGVLLVVSTVGQRYSYPIKCIDIDSWFLNPVSDVFGNHFRSEKRLTRDTLVPSGDSRSCMLTLLIPGFQILLLTYDTGVTHSRL